MGWRHYWSSVCSGTGDKFVECIERNTFNETDIFAESQTSSLTVTSFYMKDVSGIVQSLDIGVGMITQNYLSTMEILFNNNIDLSYTVVIVDPRLQIFSESPDTLPISLKG